MKPFLTLSALLATAFALRSAMAAPAATAKTPPSPPAVAPAPGKIPAPATPPASPPPPSPAKFSATDVRFVMNASEASVAAMALARTGTQRATDPEVKQFAQQMLESHERIGRELQGLATQKGLHPPIDLDAR